MYADAGNAGGRADTLKVAGFLTIEREESFGAVCAEATVPRSDQKIITVLLSITVIKVCIYWRRGGRSKWGGAGDSIM